MICKRVGSVLLAALGCGFSSCTVASHRVPITLVEFVVDGTPILSPAGPEIHIGDRYRGQPVDGRFRIQLPVGRHDLRLLSGGEVYWAGVVDVVASDQVQVVPLRYAMPAAGG